MVRGSISWLHIPDIAIVWDTSHIADDDIGSYLGFDST